MDTVTISPIPGLDRAAQALARAARRFTRIRGAGVFWMGNVPAFIGAWREPGAWTLRLGRLELQVDLSR
jgi:hypothetical protein